MKEIFKHIEDCKKCKTIIGHKKFPMKSHGNLSPFAILVSEAPGKESLSKNKYWISAGGKILRDCLPDKIQLEDLFYLTDIVKCWPNKNDNNRKPNEDEIINCAPYLLKEINDLHPKLIVSFGKVSSSYLLKRDIKITKEHGKIYQYDERTKIITLLHPSGIDRFMNRQIYKKQLTLLFSKIKEKDLNDIDKIFNNINKAELLVKEENKNDIIEEEYTEINKGTFIIPASGNSITENDVKKNQIRITVDYKEFFPSKSSEIIIEYKKQIFKAKFNYRLNKSHILKLDKELATLINLKAGMNIKMSSLEKNKYKIE